MTTQTLAQQTLSSRPYPAGDRASRRSEPGSEPVQGTRQNAHRSRPGECQAGRDPNQPIDETYTAGIKKHTTETFFLSPLVDYMPASKTVPTPAAILGDVAGAEGKLPYTKEIYDYMRLLAKSSPRVKVYVIGTSEGGREMLAVAVASEALLARLDENTADLAKLADPRTLKMDDAAADAIAKRAAPVYYITGAIHSTEGGAPTALMELAYRLAVDDSAYVRNIREHVITLITPVVEPDGRDRVVDAYNWRKKYPEPDAGEPDLLGQVCGARQQSRRDGADAEADAERAQHLRGMEGPGAARPARVRVVPLRQHHRQRSLQRVARSDPDQRVAPDRLEQRQRDDPHGHAGRVRVGHVRHVVARLPDVHRRDAQRHQPSLRNVRQQRQRRHRGADAVGRRDIAHLVPPEPADLARALVAAEQQQLPADWPPRFAEPLRQQPRLLPPQLLRQEQALDPEGEDRRPRRLRVPGQRSASRRAGRTAARAAEAEGGDFERARGLQRVDARTAGTGGRGRGGRGGAPTGDAVDGRGAGAGDPAQAEAPEPPAATAKPRARDARVPGRQLHRPDGPAVLADRGRAARLPVLVADRTAGAAVRRHRLDLPRRRSPCRPSALRTRRSWTSPSSR